MKLKKICILFLSLSFIWGCQKTPDVFEETVQEDGIFTDKDYDASYEEFTTITLKNGSSQSDGQGVDINKNIITIQKSGVYVLKGKLDNGQVIVDVGDENKVKIVLSNVSIQNEKESCLFVKSAKKVFVTLVPYSLNHIGTNEKTAILSNGDLTFNGGGEIKISSNANGIEATNVKFTSGNITIQSNGIGVLSKGNLQIVDSKLDVNSSQDSFHANDIYLKSGTYILSSLEDGMEAKSTITIENGYFDMDVQEIGYKSNNDICINDGNIQIKSKQDSISSQNKVSIQNGILYLESEKDGIVAKSSIEINGGTIALSQSVNGFLAETISINGGTTNITASKMGLNADSNISVSKGRLNLLNAGIKSNDVFEMSGGTIYISSLGNILEFKKGKVSAGSFVGAGLDCQDVSFDQMAVGCVNYALKERQEANSTILIKDTRNNVIEGLNPQTAFNFILVWSAGLQSNQGYTITAGNELFTIHIDEGLQSTNGLFED